MAVFELGLVGAGRMGRTHLRALRNSTDVAVLAVAEPVDALRDDAVSTYGVRGHRNLEELLGAGGVDGVLIVTPSDTHVDVISAVAAAGLPILCEKPCGVDAEDTRRARAIVSAADVPLQIAYWRRFVPELVSLRERIGHGDFGDVLSVSCLQWDAEPPSSAFRARSGGILIDMGVHEFDQARWLVGSDYTRVMASASPVATDAGDDPDSAQVLAVTESGTTVFVSLGRHYADGDMSSVAVFGTRDHAFSLFMDPRDGERAQLEALVRQASAFRDYVAGSPCRGATVEDAIAALEVAANASRQLALGR